MATATLPPLACHLPARFAPLLSVADKAAVMAEVQRLTAAGRHLAASELFGRFFGQI